MAHEVQPQRSRSPIPRAGHDNTVWAALLGCHIKIGFRHSKHFWDGSQNKSSVLETPNDEVTTAVRFTETQLDGSICSDMRRCGELVLTEYNDHHKKINFLLLCMIAVLQLPNQSVTMAFHISITLVPIQVGGELESRQG